MTELMKTLTNLLTRCRRVENRLQKLIDLYSEENSEGIEPQKQDYISLLTDTEFLTSRTRNFILDFDLMSEEDTMKRVCEQNDDTQQLPISVRNTGSSILITAPVLLPMKRASQKELITQPLEYALRQFREQEHITIRNALIIYRTILPEGIILRDSDNFERSRVQNLIAEYLLVDDNINCLQTMITRSYRDYYGTEIEVLDLDSHPDINTIFYK